MADFDAQDEQRLETLRKLLECAPIGDIKLLRSKAADRAESIGRALQTIRELRAEVSRLTEERTQLQTHTERLLELHDRRGELPVHPRVAEARAFVQALPSPPQKAGV